MDDDASAAFMQQGYEDGGMGMGMGMGMGGGMEMNAAAGGGMMRPKRDSSNSLMPVSVHQALIASSEMDNKIHINGRPLQHVELVGTVSDVVPHPSESYVAFVLSDGSGTIKVTQAAREDKTIEDIVEFINNSLQNGPRYFKVLGKLIEARASPFQQTPGERNITAFSVFPLSDMNYLTLHSYRIIAMSCEATSGMTRTQWEKQRIAMKQTGMTGGYSSSSSSMSGWQQQPQQQPQQQQQQQQPIASSSPHRVYPNPPTSTRPTAQPSMFHQPASSLSGVKQAPPASIQQRMNAQMMNRPLTAVAGGSGGSSGSDSGMMQSTTVPSASSSSLQMNVWSMFTHMANEAESKSSGVDVKILAKRVNIDEQQCTGLLMNWCESGDAYSTIDEHHFKPGQM